MEKTTVAIADAAAFGKDPQARITWGSKVANPAPRVATLEIENPPRTSPGLDTLRLSWWVRWPTSEGSDQSGGLLLEQLEAAKLEAQEKDVSFIPMSICGFEWNVHRTGTKQYNYHISRGDFQLLFNRRREKSPIPNTRLEIGSMSCWSPGYRPTYQMAVALIEFFGGAVIKERVSEAHLAVDLLGQDIRETGFQDMDLWVCRAHSFSCHHQHKKFSGMSHGKGKIMVRCYDKVMELKKETHKQLFFAEIWGHETFDQHPVTRVEFQLRREAFNEFQQLEIGQSVDTLNDFEKALNSLWQYLTVSWCRQAAEEVDRKNRHQDTAKISPLWQLIQSVTWTGRDLYHRLKKYATKDLHRLQQQLVGVGMTIAAIVGAWPNDPEDVAYNAVQSLRQGIKDFVDSDPAEFRRRMMVKFNDTLGPDLSPVPF